MKKFPSIEHFRHAVRAERDQAAHEGRSAGTRRYRGTVKLHGTNASIVQGANGEISYQSRNRVLKVGDDNAGFVAHMSQHEETLRALFSHLRRAQNVPADQEIAVFGEWCGSGIQKGVAISQLPKRFIIFAAHANEWLDIRVIPAFGQASIWNIFMFPTWEIEIDFAVPELAQNQMVAITEEVERRCPVGAMFGVEGIGEGVVWSPMTGDRSSKYWFKVKGEKHSASKVATLASVDVERIQNREALVLAIVTENRMEQGLDHIQRELGLALQIQNIGAFLRWVFNDAVKEETDTIVASGFDPKELGKPISDVAKRFFVKALDRELAVAA